MGSRERLIPVSEIFGPTIQGEGPLAGVSTYFVRVGLCDYRCSWCDSMYAVDPDIVRREATRMTCAQIVENVLTLEPGPRWVTISGGNPAIHNLDDMVTGLQEAGLSVAVETQGSRWHPWLARVDRLVVSPKPPSSGMATVEHSEFEASFIIQAESANAPKAVKIVVFDEDDYEWAANRMNGWYTSWRRYLSAGTDQGDPDDITIGNILDRYQWLCERVAVDPRMKDVAVLPQLHVLAWGTRRGV